MKTSRMVHVALWASLFVVSLFVFGGGSNGPDPIPTNSRHYTLTGFPSISEALIASSTATSGTTTYCAWPSWDGARFRLRYGTSVNGVWNDGGDIAVSTTDALQPALALVNGSPVVFYLLDGNVRKAIQVGSGWTTTLVNVGTSTELAVWVEDGHTWWTWRDGGQAKWVEYSTNGWSQVFSRTISTDYAQEVAAIRLLVLG